MHYSDNGLVPSHTWVKGSERVLAFLVYVAGRHDSRYLTAVLLQVALGVYVNLPSKHPGTLHSDDTMIDKMIDMVFLFLE